MGDQLWEPPGYRLTFEPGHKYAGLVVTMRSAPVGMLLDMTDKYEALQERGGTAGLTKEDTGLVRSLCEMLASVIENWNVGRAGQPVAPDADGLLAQDIGLVMTILERWMAEVVSVPPPLPASSNGSAPSDQVPPLPMAPLSPSPPS